MGSGLIYAVIVVVWAAVLIPMWLRHHDEASETRSADRFSRAMHTLSHRDAAHAEQSREHRYVVVPRRPVGATGVIRSDGPPADPLPRRSDPAPPASRRPAARADRGAVSRRPVPLAVRRRRVLAALVLVSLVLALVALASPVPSWVPGVALLCTVGYVVHLRVQARRRAETRHRSAATSRSALARLARLDSASRVFAVRSDRSAAQLAEVRAAAAEATRAAVDAVTLRVADRSGARPSAESGWEPVPVPLPTYVTKPKAVRPARSVDLTAPGVWSAGRGEPIAHGEPSTPDAMASDVGEPRVEPAAAAAGPVLDLTDMTVDLSGPGDDELDEILDRRRAVND